MNICRDAGTEELSQVDLSEIKINPIPHGEEWRLGLLHDLIQERTTRGILNEEEVHLLMQVVCCN